MRNVTDNAVSHPQINRFKLVSPNYRLHAHAITGYPISSVMARARVCVCYKRA